MNITLAHVFDERQEGCEDEFVPKTLPVLTDSSPICCAPLGSPSERLSEQDALGLAVRLKALADPVRLRLVDHLLSQPDFEACTCDLAPIVDLTDATVSHHLKQLLTAGLVTKRRDGMNVHYRLAPDAVTALVQVLQPDCC
jgi:ArsR family transcriptional regulator, arsenate/arsenite/antimonite-responsive transcriptional repressor